LGVTLQPQQPQAVHVFDRRLMSRLFLFQRDVDLGFAALISVENGFGNFAVIGAHFVVPVGFE
jgi:hypothetical protein